MNTEDLINQLKAISCEIDLAITKMYTDLPTAKHLASRAASNIDLLDFSKAPWEWREIAKRHGNIADMLVLKAPDYVKQV